MKNQYRQFDPVQVYLAKETGSRYLLEFGEWEDPSDQRIHTWTIKFFKYFPKEQIGKKEDGSLWFATNAITKSNRWIYRFFVR